jgi:hypothetical protein
MLLATNKQQHKEKTKNRKTQQNRLNAQKKTVGKNIDQVGLQNYRIIWNTPNAEIPKWDFSLLSNPLVHFKRIFRG